MNIFAVDLDPTVAAKNLCDKHIVKMTLESTQLLCSTSWHFGVAAPYKATHINHPCSIWARESISNYNWLFQHTLALCDEYSYRYGKVHKCEPIVHWLAIHGGAPMTNKGLTPFAQAMPEQYKNDNAIIAYRNYYKGDKVRFAKWKCKERIPTWWDVGEVLYEVRRN